MGTSVYGLIQIAFVVFLQNPTPEKSQDGSKALHIMVALPFCDHTQLYSTLAFESKFSCSGPPTLSLFISLTLYGLPHVNTCSFSFSNNNNNSNEYLERLTCTGPKRLHVLYKHILSKFNAYNMNAQTHARTHTHTHTHTSRISRQ